MCVARGARVQWPLCDADLDPNCTLPLATLTGTDDVDLDPNCTLRTGTGDADLGECQHQSVRMASVRIRDPASASCCCNPCSSLWLCWHDTRRVSHTPLSMCVLVCASVLAHTLTLTVRHGHAARTRHCDCAGTALHQMHLCGGALQCVCVAKGARVKVVC